MISRLSCAALLFDLDGVLVDSTRCIEDSWRDWAARHNLSAEAVLMDSHGRRAFETIRRAAPHLDAAAEVLALAAREARTTLGVFEVVGAQALLRQLPSDSWAIVTSGMRAVAEYRLRYVGLPIPAVMICADEVSSGKPNPEGYLAAARRLGMPSADCIVVEDAPAGLAAARAAKMRAIAVATTHPAHMLREADAIATALSSLIVSVGGDACAHRLEISVSDAQANLSVP